MRRSQNAATRPGPARTWLPLIALAAGLLASAAATAQPATDDAPAFSFPVDCTYGEDCFIQNYVDMRAGDGYADHRCGHLSYDGHNGTDIRVRNLAAMRAGMPVTAAAPGVVRATRDGMPDAIVSNVDPEVIEGREAGNAVAIRHGGDWETQYSHLKRGSVTVHQGERVARGQKLGEIGLSGRTEFPHVEFTIRRNGRSLDPFTGRAADGGCGAAGDPLWSQAAAGALSYLTGVALDAGFAAERPSGQRARDGAYNAERLPVGAKLLAFWVNVMGPKSGDVQRFLVRGPDGDRILGHQQTLRDAKARRFTFVGRRRPDGGWAEGCYQGQFALVRDGQVISQITRQVGIGADCPG